jgi:hypothetical protein
VKEQRPDVLEARFAEPDARRARAEAPDLHARAERAWRDARSTRNDAATRADHQTRARLLLDAAVAEADRIELDRVAAAAEARYASAIEARADVERQAFDVSREIAREQAARVARAEAERASRRDEIDRTSRGRPKEREVMRAQLAEQLRRRALLTLAAATALGLSDQRSLDLEQTIARGEHSPTGTTALAAARAAMAAAERALADARATPSPH